MHQRHLDSENPPTQISKVFGTPVVVVDKSWLPLTQLIVWGIMTRMGIKKRPERHLAERVAVGGLSMGIILGSEWLHNLAHVGAAKLVDKPMDALRIAWGMPLCVYYQIEDPDVSPKQHIARALGGPIVNISLMGLLRLLRSFTPLDSIAHEITDAGVGMNLFLSTVSLLPIPGIDGGPILKWSLVECGRTTKDADEIVVQVNKVTGVGLGAAAGVAMKRKRWFIAIILGLLSITSLGVGFGLLKENN